MENRDLWGRDHVEGQRAPDGSLLAECHDLALATGRMATWIYEREADVVRWRGDLGAVIGVDPASPAPDCTDAGDEEDGFGLRDGEGADLASWLLSPVLAVARGDAPWDNYEVERILPGPDADDRSNDRDVVVHARPQRVNGEVVGCIGVVADITATRRAQKALQEHIDRYRLLIELSPDGIVVHEAGRIVYGNQAAADFAGGGDPEQYVGTSITEFVHPDSVITMLERIAAMRDDESVSEPAEVTLNRADGSKIVVESVSVRTKWEGRPAFQAILRDLTWRRRAEASLRYQASLVDHVSDAIIGLDADGRIVTWNPAAAAIYGWTEDTPRGLPMGEAVGGEADLGLRPVEHLEAVHRRADGSPLDVRISVAHVMDQDGTVTGAVAVCADITARKRAEAARRALEERYTAVVEALDEGIVVTDADGVVSAANRSAARILEARVTIGSAFADVFPPGVRLVHPDGYPIGPDDHPAIDTLRTGAPHTNVLVGVMRAGQETQWLSINSLPLVHDGSERPSGVVCSFADVTERRRAERQLSYQATHDALTGLRNRATFVEALRQTTEQGRRAGSSIGVLFIDLDRFKLVNDSLGHLTGDEVLVAVARRIQGSTRSVDTVARLAGDEFVVLCPDLSDIDAALRRAAQIADVVSQPIAVSSGRKVVINASIGVSFVTGTIEDPEQMLRDADVAMYHAKERGRARVELFDHALRHRAQARVDIERDLRIALEQEQLDVHYQTISSMQQGHVVGVEALVRWNHPVRGPISPAEFIPIAEDTGLVLPLGMWVLGHACRQMARWRKTDPNAANAHLSVNLSARQLSDPDLVAVIAGALTRSGLDPDALYLEITESTLMDDAAGAARTLTAIRELGPHVVIDDFGTGYSSLAYLKRFPVDTLKIDRSFVDGVERDSESEAIVRAVVGLARSLHMQTVAEGVETKEQLELLRDIGVDLCQGFLVARPVAAEIVNFSHTIDAAVMAAQAS